MQQQKNLTALDLPALTAHAATLAKQLKPGDGVALSGLVGAGKSTWVRSAIQTLLGTTETVASPTFNLVYQYPYQDTFIWHFDLYRLRSPLEIYALGWEDAIAEGIVFVEWPEIIQDLLPNTYLALQLISRADDRRDMQLRGASRWFSL